MASDDSNSIVLQNLHLVIDGIAKQTKAVFRETVINPLMDKRIRNSLFHQKAAQIKSARMIDGMRKTTGVGHNSNHQGGGHVLRKTIPTIMQDDLGHNL